MLAVSPKLWVVSCGLLAGRAGIEEEEVAHGFSRINGLSAMGGVFLLLSYPAVSLSGYKRKSAVPAD